MASSRCQDSGLRSLRLARLPGCILALCRFLYHSPEVLQSVPLGSRSQQYLLF